MGAIKITPLDAVFSRLVRERAGYCCEKCGRYYPEGMRQGLHCSHLVGRANKATRWHPLGAAAHCHGCHGWLAANPVAFYEWIEAYHGPEKFQEMRAIANTIPRYRDADKAAMLAHYKAELKRLEGLRADGVTGRIDFEPWDGRLLPIGVIADRVVTRARKKMGAK